MQGRLTSSTFALFVLLACSSLASTVSAETVDPAKLDACPGYKAVDVRTAGNGLTASLELAGMACNVFGPDLAKLKLEVTYENKARIRVKVTDPSSTRYEVPESVLPFPAVDASTRPEDALIQFNYTTSPFSFSIFRAHSHEVLFTTAPHSLIFEPQYLRLATALPPDANVYGLGEHTDTFRLDPTNTTRTLWSRDAYGVPANTNLYGNHPVYFEHRATGTHAVFLRNSNGMDIKLSSLDGKTPTLEYNVIGGVLDFYFLAGSESDPVEVARQYAQLVGVPAEVPYWSFGLHQCRFGYQNYIDVANVISNYSAAKIPLETMWTDIDYMYKRRIFTVDPDYFPLNRMREIVSYLHSHDQRYILMTDPAVAYTPNEDYEAYQHGTQLDVWLKAPNGTDFLGLVWPGVTVFPDWFHPKVAEYWNGEFAKFYSPETGIDIDGAWIDMNEPSSFCDYPCDDVFGQAVLQNMPPPRTSPPPPPDAPIFGQAFQQGHAIKRAVVVPPDHSGENLLQPPYSIDNAAGFIPSRTAYTDAKHANGLVEYDTHNLYGTMMSEQTHDAMLARRPGLRTFVITRSTFAGAGRKVGKWLGDNFSDWDHYRNSIAGILGMASIYQVPMVGADICGYAENTTENLCARWATLGAFYPFMRNHNADTSISQEFYLWESVAEAARNALNIRYRLIDYIYTAFHQAHLDGTPVLNPLWYKYPSDSNTFSIDLQFFFGPALLVSPVTEENSTSVNVYLPRDRFYDFATLAPVDGTGAAITLTGVTTTQIPLHIRGGAILPLRAEGAMTTKALRKTDIEFVVAPDANGRAAGTLYLDDGESVTPSATTEVKMTYADGTLTVEGAFGYTPGVNVARVLVLGVKNAPGRVVTKSSKGRAEESVSQFSYDGATEVVEVRLGTPFTGAFEVQLH